MTDTNDPPITIAASHTVLIQKDNTHYLIRRTDWKRLRRELSSCDVSSMNWYANAGWASLGVGAGGGTSLVGIYTTNAVESLPNWAKVIAWAMLVTGVVIAIGLLLVAKDKIAANRKTALQIEADMKEIEDSLTSTH